MWSMGCILYNLINESPLDLRKLGALSKDGTVDNGQKFPYDKEIEKILLKMLQLNPKKRISSHGLMNEKFIQNCLLLCKAVLLSIGRDRKVYVNGDFSSDSGKYIILINSD